MRLNTLFKSQQLIFLVASLFFGLLTLWIFGDLASPILISIVLAVLFRPVNTYFTKIGIPRNRNPWFGAKAPNDGLSCPQGRKHFQKIMFLRNGNLDWGQKP